MTRTSKPVQTPGQAAAVAPQTDPTQDVGADQAGQAGSSENSQAGLLGHPSAASAASVGGGESSGTGETGGGEETVTISKDSLNLLLARVEALESASQNKIAGGGAQKARLPDQDEVDPKKITQPQLTEQGWVLPENFGANPNGKNI